MVTDYKLKTDANSECIEALYREKIDERQYNQMKREIDQRITKLLKKMRIEEDEMTLREHSNLVGVLLDVLSSKNDLRRLLRLDNVKLKGYVNKGVITNSEKDALRKKRELQIMQESKRVSGSPAKAATRLHDRSSG